ncbi:MAG TPA: hypothetical protein VG797_02790 [Phycisphaerales bacterium]|nr:hypothetical protein [Phycisphaerales bacterium]
MSIELLRKIQQAAVESSSDLGQIIRMCKVLAARLNSKPLDNWLLWESEGYPRDVDVPDYRILDLQITGHFSGGFGRELRNAPIPIACLPEQSQKALQKFHCRQSISSVQRLSEQSEGKPLTVPLGDLSLALGQNVYQGMNCIHAWGAISSTELEEISNAVRNKLLDFSIALEKEGAIPIEGEKGAARPADQVSQIFNTTVYGGTLGVVGGAHASTLSFQISQNSFEELIKFLHTQGLTPKDTHELKKAIESDSRPISSSQFGPKVASWIAGMTKKAATGAWDVGVGAAANILSAALSKYYGI